MVKRGRCLRERFASSRSGQGISINTIIIAAIALAVLVVLFVVFTGRFKIFGEGVNEAALSCDKGCKTVGYLSGSPRTGVGCGTIENEIPGKFSDVSSGQTCCCIS
ncbi:hypothetical protein CMO83_02075 [Candidatus Woesearchaeota archaeon]|jgi:hypothetical protein|nr:hypothetical protein [Candidatus Woesearchaeota archaeon]|tara:strand:+ start:2504 stop:2821 length:318 start_codon:yes stop_codon:yes gene_type:complete